MATATGCVKKPLANDACSGPDLGGCVIDDVDIVGAAAIDPDDIKERIATAETARVLGGVLEGVPLLGVWDTLTVEYELFDRFVLERDLARIERFYRARGFYEAHVRAGRVIKLPKKRVRVEIVVEEGPPVDKTLVELRWTESPEQAGPGFSAKPKNVLWVRVEVQNLKNELERRPRFDEDELEDVKRRARKLLASRGFAHGKVDAKVDVDLETHTAKVSLAVDFGLYCHFGPIKIVGLGDIPEDKVREAIAIEPGEDYSSAELESAEFALVDLGVFGAISIEPQLADEKSDVVPVVFELQPAALRAVKLGLGSEFSGDRSDVHGIAGWENKNFLGGLRRLSIQVRPGLAFYPTTITDPTSFKELIPELKARADLTQPGFLESRTKGIVAGSFSLFQYRKPPDEPCIAKAESVGAEENIVGYRELAGRLGVERPFWDGRHTLGLSANVQLDTPFSYTHDAPPTGFNSVLIPFLDLNAIVDLRKNANNKPDKINPSKGFYANADVQYADLGDAKDVRFQPDLRAYVPISKKVTLAARLTTGFLFPRNYGATLTQDRPSAPTPPPDGATPEQIADYQRAAAAYERDSAVYENGLARDLQLLSFRGFFSGGASSNRGYGYHGVGPHSPVNSLFQSVEDISCNVPTGGLGLWEASLEVRFPIIGSLRGSIFLDGSDVTRTLAQMRLTRPHLSAGLGLRYDTPVGPLRVDVGYRLPCAQELGTCRERLPDEGDPGNVFGLPIAVSVAIGEAF